MKLLLTALVCLTASGRLHSEIRWDAALKEVYRSEADGAEVAFAAQTPPRIDGIENYPLVVVLGGGPRVPPSEKFPYFQVRPSRNRIWGFRTISTYDATQVIAYMKRNYPIDPNRVYLVGSISGGTSSD